MSEPLLRVLDPDARPPARPRRPGPGRRARAARRASSRAGGGSSCATSTSRPGRHLQVTAYDDTQAHTANHAARRRRARRRRRPARRALRQLARRDHHPDPPGAGDQEARGARAHHRPGRAEVEADRGHDRDKDRLLPEDDPVFVALGLSDHQGRIKPSRQAKYRQVEEFLRLLDASITDAIEQGPPAPPDRRGPAADRRPRLRQRLPHLRRPRASSPQVRGLPVRLTGVDVREQSREHNSGGRRGPRRRRGVRGRLDRRRRSSTRRPRWCSRCTPATPPPTRRSPARSSGRPRWCWPRPAATTTSPPSCAATPTPAPYAMLTRHGILRERFADTLTDALRASLLRLAGLPRRRDAVRREPAHAAQHHAARGAHRRAGEGRRRAQGVRRPRGDLGGAAAARRAARAAAVRERVARCAVVRALRGRRRVGAGRPADDVVFRFQRPGHRRVQRPGRAGRAVRDHQRLRRHRPGLHRRPGHRQHRRRRPAGPGTRPTSRRSRPAGAGRGLGRRHRRQPRAPGTSVRSSGSRWAAGDQEVPAGPSSSPTPTARATPRRCWRTRAPAGSTSPPRASSAARCTPRPRQLEPDGAEPAAPSSVGILPIATDGAFFPDGRHLVLRDYGRAVVYTFPELERVADARPARAAAGRGDRGRRRRPGLRQLGGQHAPVLEVPLPTALRAEVGAGPGRPVAVRTSRRTRRPREGKELPDGGAAAAASRGRGCSGRCSRVGCGRRAACGLPGRARRWSPSGARQRRRAASGRGRAPAPPYLSRRAGLDPAAGREGLRLPRRGRRPAADDEDASGCATW